MGGDATARPLVAEAQPAGAPVAELAAGLASRIRDRYSEADVAELEEFLSGAGALDVPTLRSGLFSASVVGEASRYTGYQAVWVRDNVHIAHALWRCGRRHEAARAVSALCRWFHHERPRLDAAIARGAAPDDPMERPHVRFDGEAFREIAEPWNHAQNDALGYFLWIASLLAEAGDLALDREDAALLGRLALYLDAIRYWQDEDSGHWEERPKLEASSVGTVAAGLRGLRRLLGGAGALDVPLGQGSRRLGPEDLDRSIERGRRALEAILPAECVQPDPEKHRRYDAALLFLVHPLQEVSGETAARIAADVAENLLGAHGIRRYSGDTFWGPDYKTTVPEEDRTALEEKREAVFRAQGEAPIRSGEEAQWCLFDSTLSSIHAARFLATGDASALLAQTRHLNRALRQLVPVAAPRPGLRCPELYYLQGGRWVPNDVVPLLWAQANLSLALKSARETAET